MHGGHPRDHPLGAAAGAVHRHHCRQPGAPDALQRIVAEGRVLPHAGTHARLGQFEDDRGDAADKQGQRILEHLPGNGIGVGKGRLARGR
ncbi:hypothetical protein AYR66_14425 [Noviherbaspirillum denitrificans]|uniref:Uncharacterized protein n=1 Tax=Noviherbaspirillum denitrificans TaxID=1968433 RepID=A0A254TD18_9BURK|nr:hypothetical protein AYR66_14425 [Noviherbaspirillum denitrificans]